MPFQSWPEDAPEQQAPIDVQKMYERGFAGCEWRANKIAAAKEIFHDEMPWGYGADAAHEFGFAESGAGKLSVPFMAIEKFFSGALPGPAQERGDCVSHGQKNSNLGTLAIELLLGKPDEVSGKVEGPPEITPEGISNGVVSSAYQYWFRGYNGDGWQCSSSARVSVKNGMLLCRNYPELDIDLTEYSGRIAGKYGRTPPPENITTEGRKHLIRTSTELTSKEEVRDFLHNGYCINSCGSEGFSNSRNEHGVSKRSGSWAHAMAYLGFDDRAETVKQYNGPLVLVQNSWGKWNDGPRMIRDTQLQIPHGAFWARWDDVKRRDCYAMSGVNGWPARELPDFTWVLG